jgi:hypothetical protein
VWCRGALECPKEVKYDHHAPPLQQPRHKKPLCRHPKAGVRPHWW